MQIHMVSNSLYINSGFSKVTRYIALGLKKLNHEVNMTGLQTSQKADYHYGIQCLPIDTEHVDETTQLILNIQKTKPDIVFYMGQLDTDLNHLAKVFPKTISYSPVEGQKIPVQMANDMLQIEKNGGLLVAQCRYGQQEMKKVGISAEMIYHGYDPNIFYPTKNFKLYCYYATSQGQINTDPVILCKQGCFDCKENKNCNCQYWKEEIISILKWDKDNKRWSQNDIPISKLKEQLNNKYIYQFTGQNFGLRKQISRLLEAYSILINESRQLKDNTILAMHTLPISIRGVDLIKIITELGINENVIFTYGTFASSGWSETAMNMWYNMADVGISASSSEGFCILPDSSILTFDRGVQKIKNIKTGDKVLTHKGRFMRVSQIMKRDYHGPMVRIFSDRIKIPIVLTPKHKVLAIKTELCNKSGGSIRNICRPGKECYYTRNGHTFKYCRHRKGDEPYRKYIVRWIEADKLEIGDFVIYPRPNNKEEDIDKIRIIDYIDDFLNITGDSYDDDSKTVAMNNSYSILYGKIPTEIKLTPDMMKLFGYFIAEGSLPGDRQIKFSFNIDEKEYIEDVERIMKQSYKLECSHEIKTDVKTHNLIYSNAILANMFQNMFCPKEFEIKKKWKGKKSYIVRLPGEFLNLPKEKLSQLVKCIWRGDGSKGEDVYNIVTTSETLAHQLLYILSKFNILASLTIEKKNPGYVNNSKNISIFADQYHLKVGGSDIEMFGNIIEEQNELRKDLTNKPIVKYLKGKNYYINIYDLDTVQYNGDVWNIEVEEDNSYVCPIVVHNCLPVLEGFATGIPMIAPNCSSFTELIGEDKDQNKNRGLLAKIATQHMIQDGSYRSLVDEKDLAEKMKIMYVKKEDRETYSKNAIKFAQQYNWNKVIKEWNDLLQEML